MLQPYGLRDEDAVEWVAVMVWEHSAGDGVLLLNRNELNPKIADTLDHGWHRGAGCGKSTATDLV